MEASVLVTGGSGFVGARVIRALGHVGISVLSLDRRPPLDRSVNSIKGDITDPGSISLPDGIHTIIHCAGILESSHAGEEVLFKVNLEGTKTMYSKAKDAGVKRFVLLSTIMALGPLGKIDAAMTEKTDPQPDEPYGMSKLMAERFLLDHGPDDGVEVIVLRPPVIYGEGMSEHSSAMKTFVSIRKGIMPLVDGGGHRFNMLYVGNLAHAVVLTALSDNARSEIYHVNEGPYTLRQIISTISAEMGVRRGYFRIPRPVFYLATRFSEVIGPLFKSPPPLSMTKYKALTTDVWNMDSTKVRNEIGFEPPFTLESGVGSTCSHYGWNRK